MSNDISKFILALFVVLVFFAFGNLNADIKHRVKLREASIIGAIVIDEKVYALMEKEVRR